MSTDFYDAFSRHDADADLLLENGRWANADHHYGLAAECALKALLLQQGIPPNNGDMPSGRQYRPYRTHINHLWDSYQNFMQTRNDYPIPADNPFQDWDISQRYASKTDITEQAARSHAAAVGTLKNIIKQAIFDGVLL
ncbi:hypothetical protein [uncultured Desulfovibrio sp.]|uniref:hypothetical protein n=1 Tax=uncultured Desulfovibrio sp. TaxID=167968 RepID=UPI002638CCA5|nr:hypothetical protein [uncultured Desulfovibrio sp.]